MIKKNTIAFRLNVSSEIGYGHLKRLQTLSSFFSSFVFVIPKSSLDILIRSGVPKEKILTFSDNLGGWWNSISGLTHIVTDIMNSGNKIFAEVEISKLAVEPYKLIVIDSISPDSFMPNNLISRPDIIIRPYYKSQENLSNDHAIKTLEGAKYAIIDEKFLKARQLLKKSRKPHILLTCGASDTYGLSLKILKKLSPAPCPIDIVVGPLFSSSLSKDLIDFAQSKKEISIYQNISNMIPFYKTASLVIGRPGLTRYEAAVLGCHGIYLWDTTGYEEYFNEITKSGLADIYSSSKNGDELRFFNQLERLAMRIDVVPEKRNDIAMKIVDGKGAKRVVDEILRL